MLFASYWFHYNEKWFWYIITLKRNWFREASKGHIYPGYLGNGGFLKDILLRSNEYITGELQWCFLSQFVIQLSSSLDLMCVLSFIMCKTLQQSKNEPVVHNGKEKEKGGMEGGDFSNVIMQYFFFFFFFYRRGFKVWKNRMWAWETKYKSIVSHVIYLSNFS